MENAILSEAYRQACREAYYMNFQTVEEHDEYIINLTEEFYEQMMKDCE